MTDPVLVIGVGNDLRGDDAAGLLAARRIAADPPPGVRVVERFAEPARLLDAWEGAEVVWVVDAMRSGAPPGTVRRLLPTEPLAGAAPSSHGLGVAEAIRLARELGRLPPVLRVLAIEGAAFGMGTAPTPAVAAGAERAASMLARRLRPARVRLLVRGLVQGVGFRPFVHRLATRLALAGSVGNTPDGVAIEVEGAAALVARFLSRLAPEVPALASIRTVARTRLAPAGGSGFRIDASREGSARTAAVPPDLATCADCLAEVLDPEDRRHGHPFANCTACGPRYSVVRAVPYDRPNTTMARFPMCADCRREYEDPADRRFHAQPTACPACGPRIEGGRAALLDACAAIRAGEIVAVKGLGGFHLLCDARSEEAVARLRRRKGREEKPLALMVPDLDAARAIAPPGPVEADLLHSPVAPIVLLPRREGAEIAPAVAPGNPRLGVMLPYTPLHHLLLRELGFPVVATSGNRSEEPIVTDEAEARDRLGGIADRFLVHDRPIARHVDDSVAMVVGGRPLVLRRGRGLAPAVLPLGRALPPILAVGPHLKSTVAVSVGDAAVLSQHVGDLDTEEAALAHERTIESLLDLYGVRPRLVACDLHPDYRSTRVAEGLGIPVVRVQHHHAHVLACLADAGVEGPVLGVAWDGTGYGPDGTVWGGEFLRVDGGGYERVARLRPFRLPGGDAAVREPRRSALGLCFAMEGEHVLRRGEIALDIREREIMVDMLVRGLNSPVTSSVGRLFDAVASLVGLRHRVVFEGQAAMMLEWEAARSGAEEPYPMPLRGRELDWEPAVRAILADLAADRPREEIARRFHLALAAAIPAVAAAEGERRVALTGGCFQNALLTEEAGRRLGEAGFEVIRHAWIPPNDGGVALGQMVAAAVCSSGE